MNIAARLLQEGGGWRGAEKTKKQATTETPPPPKKKGGGTKQTNNNKTNKQKKTKTEEEAVNSKHKMQRIIVTCLWRTSLQKIYNDGGCSRKLLQGVRLFAFTGNCNIYNYAGKSAGSLVNSPLFQC